MENLREALRQLRIERHLTQADLGQNLGVSRDVIARIENNSQNITFDFVSKYAGYFKLSTDAIGNLARKFDQPFQYMLRAHHSDHLTPDMRERFERWYDRMEILTTYTPMTPILEIPELPKANDPDMNYQTLCHQIVSKLRETWGLGKAPISDPVNLIEALGYFINGEDLGDSPVFAITGKRGSDGRPGIFINTNKEIPIERQRFSIFHELCHILYHPDAYHETPTEIGYGEKKDDKEKLADCFSGNFQAPNEEVNRIIEVVEENNAEDYLILLLKSYFKVSYQTILYRLRDTGYITGDEFGSLFDQYQDKFGIKEPSPMTDPLHFNQENKIEQRRNENLAMA